MEELDQHKRIDDFLMNQMEANARMAFQQELAQNAALRQEVDLRKIMLDQIETVGDLRIKDRILKIQSQVEGEEKEEKKSPNTRRLLMITIGSIAATLIFFICYQFFNQTTSPDQLFANNYQAYDLKFGSRSTNADEKSIADAGIFYQQQKYTQAINAFEKLQEQGTRDDRVDLGLAISYLEINDINKAINLLNNAAQNPQHLLQNQAKWYLALAYLKTNDLAKSQTLLLDLSSNSSSSNREKERASNLLEQLPPLQ